MVALYLLAISAACLACVLVIQARFFFRREDEWRKRDQELRDQLWVLAGGKKPAVKYEHEKIVKVPDPEAPLPPMTAWDEAVLNDEVKEELEQVHPDAKGMSLAQIQAKYPLQWKQTEQWLREQRRPMRVS